MSLQPTALLVVGVGTIGQAWLRRYADTIPACFQATIHGLYRSDRWAWLPQPHDLESVTWEQSADVLAQVQRDIRLLTSQHRHVIVLDLTASAAVGQCYVDWLKAGAHIVCANKYAGASATADYNQLRQTIRQYQRYWRYNTTVGAGLPIQAAIRERLESADQLTGIEGNFSGSLSWIFQQYRPGDRLSTWLQAAAEQGLTEPDPRSDLEGLDVARKLLILAREAGWSLDLTAIKVQNLIPAALANVSIAEFWQQMPAFDAAFEQWRIAEHPQAEQFCYIGAVSLNSVGESEATASLQPIDSASPYANLPAGNANFVIRSQLYDANPLVIQGPGAGPDVTAAGIHTDLLDILQRL